ncbi:MAG: hypothetical protein ACRD1N_08760 [Terriglobia bacterium]
MRLRIHHSAFIILAAAITLAAAAPGTPGRRDPFKLPAPPAPGALRHAADAPQRPAVVLPPGPRGLIVSQLRLEGVVSENAGGEMIAVVTNGTDRAYFLRDGEELYDGAVRRITPGAVYFTERLKSAGGRDVEVVKRLAPASGELR